MQGSTEPRPCPQRATYPPSWFALLVIAGLVEHRPAADNPDPAEHQMTGPLGADAGPGLAFSIDRIAMNIHGNADSHIDALCHVIFDGRLYNGVAADTVTSAGAAGCSSASPRTASSAAGCCWTCRVLAVCPGWSPVTT